MIKSWKHKSLRQFYEKGSLAGIRANHKNRLKKILQFLDAAIAPEDMNLPGMDFHKLQGKQKEFYAVSLNGNWRIIFKFADAHTEVVDYLDYY